MIKDSNIDFSKLNQYFDSIYVISLKRATERHAHIRKALAGLNYTIFWGVDNQDISIPDLEKKNIYDEQKAKNWLQLES